MHRFRSGLSAAIPQGWLARESIELVSAEDRAYVAATAGPVLADMTLDRYAEVHRQQVADLYPGYEETGEERVALAGGREAVFRSFNWTPPEGEPLAELQMYVVENGQGIVAKASTPRGSFAEIEPRLREVLSGVKLGSAESGAGLVKRDESPQIRTYAAFEAGRLTTTPASAFGLSERASNRDQSGETKDVAGAWKGARAEWEKAGERL